MSFIKPGKIGRRIKINLRGKIKDEFYNSSFITFVNVEVNDCSAGELLRVVEDTLGKKGKLKLFIGKMELESSKKINLDDCIFAEYI